MKHIIRKILREEFNKTNLKKGYELKGSQWLEDFIKYEEGDSRKKGEPVLKSYKIGSDKWTIGYGHTTGDVKPDVKPNMVITKEQAEKYLKDDLEYHSSRIKRIFNQWESAGINVPITQNMFDVLTSLSFNSGYPSVRMSDFIQSLKKGDYEKTAQQILSYGLKKGFSGLNERRKKESAHFLK